MRYNSSPVPGVAGQHLQKIPGINKAAVLMRSDRPRRHQSACIASIISIHRTRMVVDPQLIVTDAGTMGRASFPSVLHHVWHPSDPLSLEQQNMQCRLQRIRRRVPIVEFELAGRQGRHPHHRSRRPPAAKFAWMLRACVCIRRRNPSQLHPLHLHQPKSR